MLKRVAFVLGGAFLLFANNGGGEPGTIVGFYPNMSSQAIGYNASKALLAGLAIWLIYRGLRPAALKQKSTGVPN